jgi:hypothetical protein
MNIERRLQGLERSQTEETGAVMGTTERFEARCREWQLVQANCPHPGKDLRFYMGFVDYPGDQRTVLHGHCIHCGYSSPIIDAQTRRYVGNEMLEAAKHQATTEGICYVERINEAGETGTTH